MGVRSWGKSSAIDMLPDQKNLALFSIAHMMNNDVFDNLIIEFIELISWHRVHTLKLASSPGSWPLCNVHHLSLLILAPHPNVFSSPPTPPPFTQRGYLNCLNNWNGVSNLFRWGARNWGGALNWQSVPPQIKILSPRLFPPPPNNTFRYGQILRKNPYQKMQKIR